MQNIYYDIIIKQYLLVNIKLYFLDIRHQLVTRYSAKIVNCTKVNNNILIIKLTNSKQNSEHDASLIEHNFDNA